MEYYDADLHNHTTGSDGKQSPLRCMLRALLAGKTTISFTDHSSIKGYKIFEDQIKYFADNAVDKKDITVAKRLLKVLKGIKILSGSEVITSYKGVIVEVLGYGIDIPEFDRILAEKSKGLKTTREVLYEGLNDVLDKNNITFDRSVLENARTLVGPFFQELMNHPENKALFQDGAPDTLKKFIYEHLYNPDSKFFVDMAPTRPSFEDTIEMIHQVGGKAFLAHPGRYKSLDIRRELDEIIGKGIDGIEVFYPDHDEEMKRFLLSKVQEHGLLASGGSDDHASISEGKQYKVGTVNIPKTEATSWIDKLGNFSDSPAIRRYITKLERMVEEENAQRDGRSVKQHDNAEDSKIDDDNNGKKQNKGEER